MSDVRESNTENQEILQILLSFLPQHILLINDVLKTNLQSTNVDIQKILKEIRDQVVVEYGELNGVKIISDLYDVFIESFNITVPEAVVVVEEKQVLYRPNLSPRPKLRSRSKRNNRNRKNSCLFYIVKAKTECKSCHVEK